MIVYRLARKAFKSDLKGTGAEKYGGRWNNIGMPMLYTCEHQSLCVLEFAVHMQLSLMPQDLYMISVEIPDSKKTLIKAQGFPYNWDQTPHNNATQLYGDQFLEKEEYLAMSVPSSIVKAERNILINPKHKLAGEIRIVAEYHFSFDKRLFE